MPLRILALQDIILIVEVADTSADYDREVKLLLYGRYGIPEVWLVDLARERVDVSREPSTGGYQNSRTLRRGQHLSPRAFLDVELAVDNLLGRGFAGPL
jgi:Uma2 family endonuclease